MPVPSKTVTYPYFNGKNGLKEKSVSLSFLLFLFRQSILLLFCLINFWLCSSSSLSTWSSSSVVIVFSSPSRVKDDYIPPLTFLVSPGWKFISFSCKLLLVLSYIRCTIFCLWSSWELLFWECRWRCNCQSCVSFYFKWALVFSVLCSTKIAE